MLKKKQKSAVDNVFFQKHQTIKNILNKKMSQNVEEDGGKTDQMHRYLNIFMMLLIIMISTFATVIYIQQEVAAQIDIIFYVAKLSLACTITFSILLICYLVEDSSTFVFLAVFNCIGYAVLNAFTGATMIGIFSKDVIFEFSSKIWYHSEITSNNNGAILIIMNMVVQLVFAAYLAPLFRFYMKDMLYTDPSDVFKAVDSAALREDHRYDLATSGKFYDHLEDNRMRNTLARSTRRIVGSLPNEKSTSFSPDKKKLRVTTFRV